MSIRSGIVALLWFAGIVPPAPAIAEVTARSEHGFATSDSLVIAAAPGRVWAALIEPDFWWNKEHSWFGKEGRFSLAPVANACFCEMLPSDEPGDLASVEHMRVLYVSTGKQLRMRGALGPLQAEAITGVLTISLEASGEGTRVTWDYVVSGFARYPLDRLAPTVDGVMTEQLTGLATFVESTVQTGH